MRLFTYVARENKQYMKEVGFYVSYDIEVYSADEDMPVVSLEDVFIDFNKAQEFVLLCNEYQLDPIHLEEFCLDYIQ